LNDFDIFEQLRKGLNIHFLYFNAICDVNSKFSDKSRVSYFLRELYQMFQDNGQGLVRVLTAKTISFRCFFRTKTKLTVDGLSGKGLSVIIHLT